MKKLYNTLIFRLFILFYTFIIAHSTTLKAQQKMKPSLPKGAFGATAPDKINYRLDFQDEFKAGQIDDKNWVAYYLPQWSSREKSKPHYRFDDDNLILQITQYQEPWCPEFDGKVKCSSLQTGLFAGELGTSVGQHAFNPLCSVRETQENCRKYTPQYGYFEIRAKALNTASNVVALWMIGYEDSPEKSGEICIVEIKGNQVKKQSALVGYGVRSFKDPKLKNEFFEDNIEIDVTQYHLYAVEWTPNHVDFYIDNQKVRTINQSPDYPMQLMLNIYELPQQKPLKGKDKHYPKEFVIDYIRTYQPLEGYQKH